jgi:hypothetical protein
VAKDSLKDRISRRLLRSGIRYANRETNFFRTFHERPKRARQVGTWSEDCVQSEPMFIVMQGPIATSDDFTLETLKIYSKHMPDCKLILSTWKDTPAEQLDPIAKLGVEVVLSDKPAVPGLFNVNMQLVSAAAGVRRAVDAGAEWILKTRTDQRLYNPNSVHILCAMAKTFPVNGNWRQRHRIIGVGHGTLKFAPYHVTDQTVFGHASDMRAYWTPPLREASAPDHWPKTLHDTFLNVPIGELCRLGAAECYFASEFLSGIGRSLDWTLEDTWAAYRDHFCFLDYTALDLYWVKYQSDTTLEFNSRYDAISNRHEVGFGDWLLLYSGQVSPGGASRYEKVQESCFLSSVAKSQ